MKLKNLSSATTGWWSSASPLMLLMLGMTSLPLSSPLPQNILTHFGNCRTPKKAPGVCLGADQCPLETPWHKVPGADNRDCYSQYRPNLICCPAQTSALPLFVARKNDRVTTLPPTTRTTLTTLSKHILTDEADELPRYPNCGTAFSDKVRGGNITKLFEFPWTTLLAYKPPKGEKNYACGASFIAMRWLVTAGHCTDGKGNGVLSSAILGEWDKRTDPDCLINLNGLRECAEPHIEVAIDRIIVHPDYVEKTLQNDIALLRLESVVDWRTAKLRNVQPICLPIDINNELTGSAVDVSGWGRTGGYTNLSPVKRKAELLVLSAEQCRQKLLEHNISMLSSQLCASGGVGVDACAGDSGGPLTAQAVTSQNELYYYLAGVVSFGRVDCGDTDFPGVYSNVKSYVNWIQTTIENNRL